MRAGDVMTTKVVTVSPETAVRTIAQTLVERGISAVPVVDGAGRLLGIVSEGDLMRRAEAGTERQPSWWLDLLASPEEKARDYSRAHGLTARDVMSREVVTVEEDSPLASVAALLERHRIKRVPVVRDGALVGIVSRANLLHGLIAAQPAPASAATAGDDAAIRGRILAAVAEAGLAEPYVNVVVSGGKVQLWGMVSSEAEKDALRVAAETAPGVVAVENNVAVAGPRQLRAGWA